MSRKRAQGTANSPELLTPNPTKRQRNTDTHFPDVETSTSTTELGLELMRLLKKSVDKTGRNISGYFLELPNKDEYPDYYNQIAMPVSLNMVEGRLKRGEYQNLVQVEQDLKRLVQNAKDYNSSKSEIYEDAERIRKAMSNFMPKHNPAYKDKEYRAVPTPIPQASQERMEDLRRSSVSTAGATSAPEKLKLTFKVGSNSRRSTGVSTEPEEAVDEAVKSAQLSLLDELSVQEDAINFEERPPKRDYPDYYKVIRNPTAINDVRIKLQKGKLNGWQAFASEVRLIWDNAKDYNEPGSDIYGMAEKLDSWLEPKLQALGAPPRTKLTLSQPKPPPSVKLKFGSSISGPSSQGITIDGESLRRQKEDLARANRAGSRPATMNGTTPVPSATPDIRRSESVKAPEPTRPSVNGVTTPSVTTPTIERPKSAVPPVLAAAPHLPSPALEGVPPTMASTTPAINGTQPHPSYPQPPRNVFSPSDNPLERKYRDDGKSLSDALISSVTFMTHPSLPNDPHWKLIRYASATKTQQSFYTYLPASHNILRVIPQLSAELKSRKNHKLCVTVNWNAVVPSQSGGSNGGQSYDFRLGQGENVIAVDIIAELKDGEKKEYAPPQLQVDFERIMLFVYLRDALGE